jgi:uncharacterized protein (TIGR02145 family)
VLRPSYIRLALVAFLLIFSVVSCQKDSEEGNNGIPNPSSELWGSSVNVSINGRVFDQNGDPVSGAQVSAGNSNTTTDAMGVFNLTNVSAYERLAYVKVEKAGFFPGSRSFVPGSSAEVLEIKLLPKSLAGTVTAINGGTVNAQGVSITIFPNSVVKSDNTPHTGNVNISLAYIDPTGANFNREMPGNLLGVLNNQAQGLTSYGMVAVELTTSGGLPLQLAQGMTAELHLPIPVIQQSSAPSSIDLWSFDEVNGYWKHEGQATKTGTKYIAQVGHFSFWNCDVPWNLVVLDGTVKDVNNQPIQGASVTISGSNIGSASDITNTQGTFGGYVPANMPLSISVAIACGGSSTTVYTANIGPFTSNTTLNPITINTQNITTVTGTVVDCINAPLANSYVIANGQVVFAMSGNFVFQACGGNVSITPYGTTPWVAGSSQIISVSGGTFNLGNLQACSNTSGTGTVTDVDGNTYTTVIIGTQEWMAENLKTTKYITGDTILTNLSNSQWQNTTIGAYSIYNNSSINQVIYGKLYNWFAVADPRGLCPTGWHVPTNSDWNILIKTLDSLADTIPIPSFGVQSQIAGGSLKSIGTIQAGNGLWESPNGGATNSSGFNGHPSGFRDNSGAYYNKDLLAYFWTSTTWTGDTNFAHIREIQNLDAIIGLNQNFKTYGLAVRCIKN